MILVRSPLRISFAGGGSDLPDYCNDHLGAVVSTTILPSVFISILGRQDGKIRLAYSKIELVDSVDDIQHDIIREILRHFKSFVNSGIEIVTTSDLPSGAGLGSSGSFTIGMIQALLAYYGKFCTPKELYNVASTIEIERCGKRVGYQDQLAAAIGGFNYYEIRSDGMVSMSDLSHCRYARDIRDRLLLVDTGMYGASTDVLSTIDASNRDTVIKLGRLAGTAVDFRDSFLRGYIDECGRIVDYSWSIKKSMSDYISNSVIDEMYESAKQNGAIGGKLCGAGGRGMFLLLAEQDKIGPLSYHIWDKFKMRSMNPLFYPQGSSVSFYSW